APWRLAGTARATVDTLDAHSPSAVCSVGVSARQGADVGVAAGAGGSVALPGAGPAEGGEGVGDGAGGEGVDGLVEKVHGELPAGPGGRWGADAGRVLQDLVVGEADDGELGGRDRSAQS